MSAQNQISTNSPLPKWQQELARKRQKACETFKFLVQEKGIRPVKASRIIAQRYRGRRLKSRPSHRMGLHPQTALKLYNHWLRNGESPSAFHLNYRPGLAKLNPAKVTAFIAACLLPEIVTYDAAYARHGDKTVTRDAYYHALTPGIRHQLSGLFAQRRAAIHAAQTIRRTIPPAK